MTASQKLLVNLLVAASAVARSQPVSADDKTVMLFFLLSGGGLVAFQAVHALLGVLAHLVFVDDRLLGP